MSEIDSHCDHLIQHTPGRIRRNNWEGERNRGYQNWKRNKCIHVYWEHDVVNRKT